MALPLLPVVLAAFGAAALLLRPKKKTPPVRPAGAHVVDSIPAPTGLTVEEGAALLRERMAPGTPDGLWFAGACFNHVSPGNPDFVANEYVAHLKNHLVTVVYPRLIARGNTVAQSVDGALFEAGALCGTFLPPGWSEITEDAREASLLTMSPQEQLILFEQLATA